MIVAGEASGDAHGARLVDALRRRHDRLVVFGIGGRALRDAGVRILMDADRLSVVGITEVVSKLPQLMRGISTAKEMLRRIVPDLLVLIDFPDFNLHLAGTAKRLGIPVLYYISPQIWAWRQGRVRKIRNRVDRMAVILPFEEAFYRRHGVPVRFVGHPLMDALPDVAETPGADTGRPVIGLLPGSRDRELERHLPVMLQAAAIVQQRLPDVRFLLSVAPSVDRDVAAAMLGSAAITGCDLHEGPVADIFRRSTVLVAASGTVTLEAALSGTPMVIIYRISPVSYVMGRLLIRVRHAGLINLIAGKTIVPELLQKDATPDKIAHTLLRLLETPGELQRVRRELSEARALMGGPGASDRAAELALEMLQATPKYPV